MFVDSHCHLNMLAEHSQTPVNIDEIMADAKRNRIEKMLCVAVNTSDWQAMKALCQPYRDKVSLSAGIHPCYMDDQDFTALTRQANDPDVVAIGESGLDYFYCQDKEIKQKQRESFAKHIHLSAELNKPLIVHTRDAREDTIAVMQSENAERGTGVMHCFTETLEMAKAALDLGFYISFSGIITFKNAEEIRDVCRYVPLDSILIETDSPYLAPVPYRGKMNRPCYVQYVAEQVADIKDLSTEEIAKITSDNFYRLFTKAA
ncbi:MAG: metal-dependent hydrolase [Gammaproteobacteria bacterium]|nr:MAG: metal-dependent hydrolase [Gammaproteobacteria bacterium]